MAGKPQRKKGPGKFWHHLEDEARLGDIEETVAGREPRLSDPFPKEADYTIKMFHMLGYDTKRIDLAIRNMITRGQLEPWKMYISD